MSIIPRADLKKFFKDISYARQNYASIASGKDRIGNLAGKSLVEHHLLRDIEYSHFIKKEVVRLDEAVCAILQIHSGGYAKFKYEFTREVERETKNKQELTAFYFAISDSVYTKFLEFLEHFIDAFSVHCQKDSRALATYDDYETTVSVEKFDNEYTQVKPVEFIKWVSRHGVIIHSKLYEVLDNYTQLYTKSAQCAYGNRTREILTISEIQNIVSVEPTLFLELKSADLGEILPADTSVYIGNEGKRKQGSRIKRDSEKN